MWLRNFERRTLRLKKRRGKLEEEKKQKKVSIYISLESGVPTNFFRHECVFFFQVCCLSSTARPTYLLLWGVNLQREIHELRDIRRSPDLESLKL